MFVRVKCPTVERAEGQLKEITHGRQGEIQTGPLGRSFQ
jgi:hypothetical protein